MKMVNLPDLRFEHTVPYKKMGGRIGWTAHRVRSHINSFCTKHSPGCSTDVRYDARPINCQPAEDASLCINCKNTVWEFGTTIELRRQINRANRWDLMAKILRHIPEELRDIILDFQFAQTAHPIDIMKWGWDSIPACTWRVDKFHEEEAMDLWRDEESDRETIEWIEEENRWQENEHGGIYYWVGRGMSPS